METTTTTTQSETSAGADKPSLNPDALNQLLGQMINDLGASVNGALVVLGDKLGIYTALADIGRPPSKNRPKTTGLHERHFRECFSARASSESFTYMPGTTLFFSLQNR